MVMSASSRSGAQRRRRRGSDEVLHSKWYKYTHKGPFVHACMGLALTGWRSAPLMLRSKANYHKQQYGGEAGRSGSDEEGRGAIYSL